ncbi:hypothetical protein [Roseivivax isoporae]|uniref:Uncharacterized protein n=1 Tax=Roseivivax isoporae LMG 25204 TaxID=1449351 RepID=X7F120_9RHOB|nr:hypothetical protein [Roseivivax isoporae]ETX26577.1 hypothetical protein RISW2_21920 [Roseivivax isoporae LMG 25204]
MPTWPASLPFFPDAAAMTRSAPINTTIRTPMSAGPDKTRPRFSAASRSRPGRIHRLTKAQLQAFEVFYRDDLKLGALSFTATDPFDCTEYEFRILDYAVGRSGAVFTVDAELEILP